MIGRDPQATHDAILGAVKNLREFVGDGAMNQLRGLLVAIDDSYKQTLADVSVADLPRIQGALKQNRVLHDALFGPEGTVPRL